MKKRLRTSRAARLARRIRWALEGTLITAGLDSVLQHPRTGSRVILFHGIGDATHLPIRSRFLEPARFRMLLERLQSSCDIVPLQRFFSGELSPDRFSVALTFDDGYANNLVNALPILEDLGLPATFFLTGSALHEEDMLWPEAVDLAPEVIKAPIRISEELWELKYRKGLVSSVTGAPLKQRCKTADAPFLRDVIDQLAPIVRNGLQSERHLWRQLTEDEIRTLAASESAEIGAHGLTHTSLLAMPEERCEEELRQSKHFLERLIGRPVTTLAWPDGAYSRDLVELASQIGFRHQAAVDYRYPEDTDDPRIVSRLVVNPFVGAGVQERALRRGHY